MLPTTDPLEVPEISVRESGVLVKMSGQAHAKMYAYIDASPIEISGWGRVEREGNVLRITDVWLTDQVNTEVNTHMIGESLARLMRRLHLAGKTTEGWDCHWHSHVNMPPEFSGTDFTNMNGIRRDRPMVFIVANKRRELRCRVEIHTPKRYAIDRIPLLVEPFISKRLREQTEKDMTKCRDLTPGEEI